MDVTTKTLRLQLTKLVSAGTPRKMPNPQTCIWDYFSLCQTDNAKAVCKICQTQVSRGGKSAKSFSPTNLETHLQRHEIEYREYLEKKKEEETAKKRKSESHASSSTTSLAKRVFKQQQSMITIKV